MLGSFSVDARRGEAGEECKWTGIVVDDAFAGRDDRPQSRQVFEYKGLKPVIVKILETLSGRTQISTPTFSLVAITSHMPFK
jgi:hypothetical protein